MAKHLIIVESPAKTRTIRTYLGPEYEIMASMGHVRDLPAFHLGVDVAHGYAPQYETIKTRTDVLKKLAAAAKKADAVFLATDPDREGEAIAWHLREALDLKAARRIEFNEITRTAITNALLHPRDITMPRVDAQQARRILDRLVGYPLSRWISHLVQPKLSAGRVQSVALKLVCDREREIQAFVAEEFWTITATLTPEAAPKSPFTAKLVERDGQKLKLGNEKEATEARTYLETAKYRVAKVEVKEQRRNAQPPFITSTLQQEAVRAFGFSAKRTMALAQQLYEGVELGAEGHAGLITYMRTDSTRVADEAKAAAAAYIESRFGAAYLPKSPRATKAGKNVQDAHEAIRPTDVTRTPEAMAQYLSAEQLKLYRLIWRRFLASQMSAAVLEITVVDVAAGPYTLRANAQRVLFDGHLALAEEAEKITSLPVLKTGDPLILQGLECEQQFTQPPPRYTEGTLVKALEAHGVGRPSTYAPTLTTILDREYVALKEKKFHATPLGMNVNEQLEHYFPKLVDAGFTAEMEKDLDAVETGERPWQAVLEEFYPPFKEVLDAVEGELRKTRTAAMPDGKVCPTCGKPLVLRLGRRGWFIACTSSTRGRGKCNFTADVLTILTEAEARAALGDDWEGDGLPRSIGGSPEPKVARPDITCPLCGAPMVERQSKRGPFLGCSNYPKCRGIVPIENTTGGPPSSAADSATKAPPRPLAAPAPADVTCPKCGGPMILRQSARGPFYGCAKYPKCRGTRPLEGNNRESDALSEPASSEPTASKPALLEPTDEKCPKCGAPMVVKNSRRGPFLGCSKYPDCNGTKRLPRAGGQTAPPAPRTPAKVTTLICPECGKPMVERTSGRGPFLGCSGYPRCRHTMPMPAGGVEYVTPPAE